MSRIGKQPIPVPDTVTAAGAPKFLVVNHKRYLVVRMDSSLPNATIRISLLGQNGKVIARLNKTIKANHLVRVMAIAPKVHGFRVAPLAI